jgi:hypothetical protein
MAGVDCRLRRPSRLHMTYNRSRHFGVAVDLSQQAAAETADI